MVDPNAKAEEQLPNDEVKASEETTAESTGTGDGQKEGEVEE